MQPAETPGSESKQSPSSQTIVTVKQFQICYNIINDFELSITVCNVDTLAKYCASNMTLKHINCKGLEMALQKHRDFSIDFQEVSIPVEGDAKVQDALQKGKIQENWKNKQLKIKVKFNSSFLVNVGEQVFIPCKGKISQLDFYFSKTNRIQQKLKVIQENIKSYKIAKVVQQKQFKSNMNQNDYNYDQGGDNADYDIKLMQQIQLPEYCKYFIEVSMLLNCRQTYFYFYKDKVSYQSVFPSGAMTVPANNLFVPIKFSYVFDNRTLKQKQLQLFTYDIMDYPCQMRNLVITATKIDQ